VPQTILTIFIVIAGEKMYRCRAVLLPAFIQQLAVAYVARGYWFYVSGWIPFNKDAEAVDCKLIEKYGIDISKWERARRKKAGLANLHYLRHGRNFVLIATHGKHRFFEEEAAVIRDIRRVPFRLGGYSVSYRKLTAPVRLPAAVVEEAFLKANPGWEADMLTITCKQGRIQEARLCLSKDLDPVPCGRDVVRDCQMTDALFDPIR